MPPKMTRDSPDSEESGQFEVDQILKHKKVAGEYQFYVSWKGFDESEHCWVEEDNMNCPETVKAYFDRLEEKKALKTPVRSTRAASLKAESVARAKATPAKPTPAKTAKATPAKPRPTPARAAKMAVVVDLAKEEAKETPVKAKRGRPPKTGEKRKAEEKVEETPKRRRNAVAEKSRAVSARLAQSSSNISSTVEEQSDDDEAQESSKSVPTTDIGKSLLEAYERANRVNAKSPRPATRRQAIPISPVVEEEVQEEEEIQEEEPSPVVSPPSAEDPKSRCVIS